MSYRHRTRGQLTQHVIYELGRQVNCFTPNWSTTFTSPTPSWEGTVEIMDDFVTPDFRKRQKRGEVFFSPKAYEKRAYVASSGGYGITSIGNTCSSPAWKAEYDAQGPWLRHCLPSETFAGYNVPKMYVSLTGSDYSRMATEVSTSVLNKRGRADSNLWETVAELHKTFEMLRRPFHDAIHWNNSFVKTLERDRAGRFLAKSFANNWLKYRYGIRPVVQDVQNILKALNNLGKTQRKTTRAYAVVDSTTSVSGVSTVGILSQPWTNMVHDRYEVRGMSLDDVDLSLSNEIGFTSKGLYTLPWELVRYSFVIDWVLNVGDIIGALTPAVGWKMLGSSLVANRVVTNAYSAGITTNTSPLTYSLNRPISGTVGITSISKNRSVGLSSIGLVVKNDFRLDDPSRLIDSITLLAQRMKKTLGNVAP